MAIENNILIVAGEKSGEEHLLSFFPTLQSSLKNWNYWGVGGDYAEKAGLELIYHLKNFGSMGISEVIGKVPFYSKAMTVLVNEASRRNTKAAILIDFQDFNLRLAKKLTKNGIKVFYYVAPQAWVWRPSRASLLRKYTTHLFCILPFEKDFFKLRGVKNISTVVHPVYRKIEEENLWSSQGRQNRREILLLPGSRNSEVLRTLPVFLKSVEKFKGEYKISIVQTTSVSKKLYEGYNDSFDKIYSSEELYDALSRAKICLAASGTVTLACALLNVPTIIGYKVSLLNELFYRVFVPYKGFIGLANLISGREIFPEFIQDRFTVYSISKKVKEWLSSDKKLDDIICLTELVKQNIISDNVDVSEVISTELMGK